MSEVRYYKGKYEVEVLQKSKGNWLVKALEEIPYPQTILQTHCCYRVYNPNRKCMAVGERIVTVPRLLWRKKRGEG